MSSVSDTSKRSSSQFVLGIDVGTTSVKVCLVDTQSKVVMCEPHFFGFREGSSLPFFGIQAGRVGQNLLRASGQAGILCLPVPNLGIEPVRA